MRSSPLLQFAVAGDQSDSPDAAVLNVMLNCQIRIEPTRRSYGAARARFAVRSVRQPGPLGSDPAEFSLDARKHPHSGLRTRMYGSSFRSLAASISIWRRPNISTASKMAKFRSFSSSAARCSTAMSRTTLQIGQIAWSKESAYRLPVQVWRAMMDHYYPQTAWLCLRRDAFDELYRYKRAKGLPSFEHGARRSSGRKTGGLAVMKLDRIKDIANAVLYEGYHPLSLPAVLDQKPPALDVRRRFSRSRSPAARAMPSSMQTQLLAARRHEIARSTCTCRFLQVLTREVGSLLQAVAELTPEVEAGAVMPVPRLEIDGKEYLAWEEAIEREVAIADLAVRGHRRAAAPEAIPLPAHADARNLSEFAKAKSAVS